MIESELKYSYLKIVPSEWTCHLCGCTYTPRKGQHPNWFWRKMQYLIFGARWIKNA